MDQELHQWRIRVDIRSVVGIPVESQHILPTTFVECGWTIYDQRVPDEQDLFISNPQENDTNPVYNQQALINPPASVHDRDGFLYVSVQDISSY